jgi:acetyltransferase-like isoleucine patch superfamily enzyme
MRKILSHIFDYLLLPFKGWIIKVVQTRPYVHGSWDRVFIGDRVSLVNTLINTASGNIYIEDDVIFGHNCMLLTGRHDFKNGKRKKLSGEVDTPHEGYDIRIRSGCWLASGSMVVGRVTIGTNSIIAAGAVVTKDVPDHSIVAGIPAKVIGSTLITK